jgi:large subunit ribosomal protein L25
MELTVECQKRPEGSKPNALRRAGLIPANLYGHKGTESISLTLDAKTAERLMKKASINNTLVDLNITDIPWRGQTLIREVQAHPAKGSLYHLSFFAVSGQESLDVEVPLHFVGDAVGVKPEGGLLDPAMTQLQVRCAPGNIPDTIEVNVSNLHIGNNLHVREIVLPQGVTALDEPERVVVSVLSPQKTVEDTAAETAESES